MGVLTNLTDPKSNIYLIGMSGTGKSMSGRRLAELIGWPFVEMDGVIEDRAGKSIPRIFEENGEPFFRDMESEVLAEIAKRSGRVVSTGGGVPLRYTNRKTMESSGVVILLSASPEVLHGRLANSVHKRGRRLRPLLGDEAPVDRLREMLAEREDVYATARITINTENKSHDQVAALIASEYQTIKLGEENGQ